MLSARNFNTTTWNSFRNVMASQPGRLIAAAALLLALTLTMLVYSAPAQAQILSTDATLSALTVSPRDIIGFAADRPKYSVGVASTVATATVSATPNHSGADAAKPDTIRTAKTPLLADEQRRKPQQLAPGEVVLISSWCCILYIATTHPAYCNFVPPALRNPMSHADGLLQTDLGCRYSRR